RRSKILRAIGAAFVQRREGTHPLASNSQVTSATRLRVPESAIVFCFVFSRKICCVATFDFCNTIGPRTEVDRATLLWCKTPPAMDDRWSSMHVRQANSRQEFARKRQVRLAS